MVSTCKICAGSLKILYTDLFDDRYGYPGKFTVLQCQQCGFGQIDPEPTEDSLQALYTQYYPRQNITASGVKNQAHFTGSRSEWLKRYVLGTDNSAHHYSSAGEKVLDIGCGDGTSLLEIQKLGGDAYGTEYDNNVRPIADQLQLKIHFGTLESSPWPDHYFDAITMSQLIEHVLDPIQFLNTIHKKLKPAGRVVLGFPNLDSFNRKKRGRRWINWHIPYHVNFFTKRSIEQLSTKTNFNVTLLKTTTPLMWMHLQFDMDNHPAIPGQPGPTWSSQIHRNLFQNQLRKLRLALATPYYRLIDKQLKGDSWLVILTPKP